jgi:hypothetical protein
MEAFASLGFAPFNLPSSLKPLYHACAVMASGHLATLVLTAAEILKASGVELPGSGLAILARSAIANAAVHGKSGITGPFARGDEATIQRDCAALPDDWRRLFMEIGRMRKKKGSQAGSPTNPLREGCPYEGQSLQTQKMGLYCEPQKAPVQVHPSIVS